MFRTTLIVALLVVLSTEARAGVPYFENFDVDHSASWTVNPGISDEAADFFFDYSTVGIPIAPNSPGTTRGLLRSAR